MWSRMRDDAHAQIDNTSLCIYACISMQTAKLIVQPTETSLEILRFLNEIIVQVNEMGMKVEIEKISKDAMDDELAAMLKRLGVRALPALLIKGRQAPVIGSKAIKVIFEKNLAKLGHSKRLAPIGVADQPATELDDYWMREMTDGMKKGPKGKIEFEHNGESPMGEGDNNFERRMAEDRKKRKGRMAQREPEPNEEEEDAKPRRRRAPPPEDPPTPPAPRRQRDNIDRTATTGDEQMDRDMMAAYLENNGL